MRKFISTIFILISFVAVSVLQSCKKDAAKQTAFADQSFVEEFDTASAAVGRGWKLVNTSEPIGSGVWKNGGGSPAFFEAYSNKGSFAGFIGADYLSTSAEQGTISNWLVSPSIMMQNGDKIIFYTRSYTLFYGTGDTTDFGNSLQVRINPDDDSVNVGDGLAVGGFTKILLIINQNLTWSSVVMPGVIAYPTQWTRFEVTVRGLDNPLQSRFALRYYVTDGGSNGNGTGIGIDSVAYQSVGYH